MASGKLGISICSSWIGSSLGISRWCSLLRAVSPILGADPLHHGQPEAGIAASPHADPAIARPQLADNVSVLLETALELLAKFIRIFLGYKGKAADHLRQL